MPALAWLLLFAGCAELPAPASSCLLPAEQHMLVAELFFGHNIKGRQPLSDAEWAEFAAQTIAPNFPDGFTLFDGEGQWRNPGTGRSPAAGPKSCSSQPSLNPISRGGCRR
jgi:hypothetical protein